MKLKIAGLEWRAFSPSYLELADSTVLASVALWYDGRAWKCLFPDGLGPQNFRIRDQAAQAIADGINAYVTEQWA